jgi:hypothetical protein
MKQGNIPIQDIEDVLVIERLAYKIPWNKAKFTHSLHNPNTVACLIFKDNQVLGYSIALRASKVADLLNICILIGFIVGFILVKIA